MSENSLFGLTGRLMTECFLKALTFLSLDLSAEILRGNVELSCAPFRSGTPARCVGRLFSSSDPAHPKAQYY